MILLDFAVANYRSFKDEVRLSLEAGTIKERETENVLSVGDRRVLKGAVIYGANASGKSNLIRAINFFKHFVSGSSKESQHGDPIPVEPFRLSTSTEGEPSMFEVRIVVEGVPYRYGFQVTRQMVAEEWLYVQKTLKSEAMLFSRDRQDIKLRTGFSEGK